MALIVPDTDMVQLNGPRGNGPVDTYSRASVDTSAIQLGEALSKLGGRFIDLAGQQANAQEAADMRNLEHYVGKARQEIIDGVPAQAQLGNILPEQSNVVRGRVAESLGFEEGQKWVQDQYATLMADQNLIMDPAAFTAAADGIRKQAYQKASSDPAFGAGFLKAVDGTLNQGMSNATQMRTKAMQDAQERQYEREFLESVEGEGDPGPLTPTAYGVPSKGNPMANPEIKEVKTNLKQYLTSDKRGEHIDGLNDDFATSIHTMIEAAPPEIKQGLKLYSGYRSPQRQEQLWDAALKKYGSAEAARKWVAPPGRSQHNHGNAMDLKYASPQVRQWVHANAEKFGLHFALGNEPWHMELKGARGGKRQIATAKVEPVAMTASTPVQVASNTVPTGPVGGVGTLTDSSPAVSGGMPDPSSVTDNSVQVAQATSPVQDGVAPEVQAARNRLRHLDNNWAKSSSLTQDIRRQKSMDALVRKAAQTLDDSLLDRIPPEWIDPENEGRLVEARRKIQSAAAAARNAERQAMEQARKEAARIQKNEINQKFISGGNINPADYVHDPDLFEYALKRQQEELYVDPVWSQTNRNNAETQIEKAALTNEWSDLGFDRDIPPSREDLDNWVDNLPDMKAADRIKLKEKIPELMEIGVFVGGKQAKEWYDEYLATGIKAYLNSPEGMMASLKGNDMYAVTKSAYDTYLRHAFRAYVEENGRPPTGQARIDIYEKAVQKAKEAMQGVNPLPQAAGKGQSRLSAPGSNRNTDQTKPDAQESSTGKPKGRWITHPDGSREFVRE